MGEQAIGQPATEPTSHFHFNKMMARLKLQNQYNNFVTMQELSEMLIKPYQIVTYMNSFVILCPSSRLLASECSVMQLIVRWGTEEW